MSAVYTNRSEDFYLIYSATRHYENAGFCNMLLKIH